MQSPFRRARLTNNFPERHPWYKKVRDNVALFVSCVMIYPRRNLLSTSDLFKIKRKLRRGDILIVGDLRTIFSKFVRGPVTHSAIYLGRKKIIHVEGDGVRIDPLKKFLREYDTLAILRLPKIKARKKTIERMITYAKQQIGKPFNFDFSEEDDWFYCSELVYCALKDAGYDPGVQRYRKPVDLLERFLKIFTRGFVVMAPKDLVNGNFETVFLSHNLRIKDGELLLTRPQDKSQNMILRTPSSREASL